MYTNTKKGDCKSSMYVMMDAIDQNIQYMQTHGVFIPEFCWLNNNKYELGYVFRRL
jgi:hypothetical protein